MVFYILYPHFFSTESLIIHKASSFDDNMCVSFSVISVPVCRDSFEETLNANVAGGTRVNGVNTPTGCREECWRTNPGDADLCYGYDFNTQDNSCWLINSDFQPNTQITGINNYKRVFTCSATTTPGKNSKLSIKFVFNFLINFFTRSNSGAGFLMSVRFQYNIRARRANSFCHIIHVTIYM